MSDFFVHTIPGSPFARAVLAVLEEKRASYRVAAMAPGTQRSEPHISRHPFDRVPVIEHGDFVLYETQAILRYLDRTLPTPSLTPVSAKAAARMDQAMGVNDWYLFQGVANVIVFNRVVGPRLLGLATDETVEVSMRGIHGLISKVHQWNTEARHLAGFRFARNRAGISSRGEKPVARDDRLLGASGPSGGRDSLSARWRRRMERAASSSRGWT